MTCVPREGWTPLPRRPDMELRVALGVASHCLHSSPGALHHAQIIASNGGRRGWVPWPPSPSLCGGMTAGRPFSTSFRNSFVCTVPGTKASRGGSRQGRQRTPRMPQQLCAGCLCLVCRANRMLLAQNSGDLLAADHLRPFPCPVLLQLCFFPINSSISFIWKGVAAYHPFNARFRMLSLESPGSSEGWHLISTQCQKTALVLVFSYHNVSKTFQWKKEIQSI